MKIAGYHLRNGDDPREIIVFKREKVDESGKKPVRYAIWNRHNPHFGICNPSHTHAVGLPIKKNKKLIKAFLDNVIKNGESKVCYKYIGATEQVLPEGYITEIIPVICDTKKYDTEVIDQFKKMRKMVDEL